MTQTLTQLAEQIKNSSNLYALRSALIAFETAATDAEPYEYDAECTLSKAGMDLCTLPTFGGSEPSSTVGVWSWDADNLLVGEGRFSEWDIVSRQVQS